MRQWHLFYNKNNVNSQQAVGQIAKQPVSQLPANQTGQQLIGQITQIPWGHNIVIITKCKNIEEALYYVQNTIKPNWSRAVLVHQIESGLYKREGKAVNNSPLTLPKSQADLAIQTLKDFYIFDFLRLTQRKIMLKAGN